MAFRVDPETLHALGWSDVIQQLCDACRTVSARSKLLASAAPIQVQGSDDTAPNAPPLFEQTLSGVQARLSETSEARVLLDSGDLPPIGTAQEIGPLLDRAQRGAVLEPGELLDVHTLVEGVRTLAHFLCAPAQRERAPNLARTALQIDVPQDLEREINRCIDPGASVRDSASPRLADARRETIRLGAELQKRLERYLQDSAIADNLSDSYYTVRNDRYVLPVKADAKGRVPGIVHDASRSGTTLFIEPEAAVEMNNRLKQSELAAQHETLRILRELTAKVADAAPTLRNSVDALIEIDCAFARARLSQEMNAVAPTVGDAGVFELPGLRHPLMGPDDCVPNDVRLGDEFQVLVLSGPNAGGKTVTLKAVALAALFVRAGLFVTCDAGGRADLVEDVIAEIGDGQDISESLSTFSAHMASLARIVARADRHTLVVLDEIGVGTDPGEGAALAQAILERLADAGTRVITTTHYNLLKEMADIDPRFENASVEFDPETLAPTYRLRIGEAGTSSAASVASRMGMPSRVLERADSLMSREDRQLDRMLTELAASRATLESERRQVEQLRAESEATRNDYRTKLERLQERRDELFRSMRDELDAAFRHAHGEVASVIRELQQGPSSQKAGTARKRLITLEAKARTQEAEAGITREADPPPGLIPIDWRYAKAGDPISLAPGREGILISLPDRKGRATVRVGSAKLVLPAEQVGRSPTGDLRPAPASRVRVELNEPAPAEASLGGGVIECDLRGQRVEEALTHLGEVLDRAAADGRDTLRVIHGHGTGALRRAIREYLTASAGVDDLRAGADEEGGNGVSIVRLR